jgi:hypothetical protein
MTPRQFRASVDADIRSILLADAAMRAAQAKPLNTTEEEDMATQRVYVVFDNGKPSNLVRAKSAAQAVRHVSEPRYEAVVADQDHLTSEWARAMKVETASAEPV